MSSKETTPPAHAAGTSDNASSRKNPGTVISNKDLALSLDNINENMGKMASLLAKLCDQPNTGVHPPGSKRKSTSDVSDISDSEYDDNTRKSGKRRRCDGHSDDASHDLDDADGIQMLTERSKATGQKAWETPAKETKLLKDFANSFDEDDATGEKIQQELADIAVKRWNKKLSTDKIKSLVDKYKQPQNCSEIKTIKVNPEIWSQRSSTKRETDLKISNLQQIIRKITFATLQTTNMLIHTSAPDNKIMAQQVDSIAMLGHLNTQLARSRELKR